jgi:uncharacterized repeat protein (TIGR03803 family)
MIEELRRSWSFAGNATSKLRNSRLFFSRPQVLLSALLTGLGLMLAARVTAQTFTTLHSFAGPTDGAVPYDGLILLGNTLYGTTYLGGSSNDGTIFKINTDGTCFTNMYNFTDSSDGSYPGAGLTISGNILYGTASDLFGSSSGDIFQINADGKCFTNLYNFTTLSASWSDGGTNSDGAIPLAALIISGDILYGTTYYGGDSAHGTVFAVNTNGMGFTNLHSFTVTSGEGGYLGTNSDGALPEAGLVLLSNILYGTASFGGNSGNGTVFAINTNGTGFTNLHSFIGSDGSAPSGGLVVSGNALYGTTKSGGSSSNGTVFKINTDGTGFTNFYNFTATAYGTGNSQLTSTNGDGVNPRGSLILSGNTLFGIAEYGGNSGYGTVFAVNTDGTGFTTLHGFTIPNPPYYPPFNRDGIYPFTGLILSGNILYGTTTQGGSSAGGTVFSISLLPQLNINLSGTNVILSWPTNVAGFDYSGFTLQSTTNLFPAAWNTNSPPPVVVNGRYTVTNPISGTQMYYQLSQ